MGLTTSLLQLAEIVDAGGDIVTALQAIRDGYTDEAYEAFETEHPLIAELIVACTEIEDHLGR